MDNQSEEQKEKERRERKAAKVIAESGFKAREIGLSAQKKILSKMAGTSMSRMFIDENTSNMLDHLYVIAKIYTNDKKEAEKLIKYIIKAVIKFAMLFRNDSFDDDQKMRIIRLKAKLKIIAMNVMTFYEMDYTYDRAFMIHCLNECYDGVMSIAQIHFTPRTLQRIDRVFSFFNNEDFLDRVFNPDSEFRDYLSVLVTRLHVAFEKKVFG